MQEDSKNTDMILASDIISTKIIILRWEKVILDKDLALLYEVETKYLKRQVKRNTDRFPDDFAFQLTKQEFSTVRWHFGTSRNTNKWWSRILPFAFTEHWILMLSSILKSKKATQVNIAIMRVFTHMRKSLSSHEHLKSVVLENQEEIQKIRYELQKLTIENEQEKDDEYIPIGFQIPL